MCNFMKMLFKLAFLGTAIGLASNYKMPMINKKTRKRIKKQARMLQSAMGGFYNNMAGILR